MMSSGGVVHCFFTADCGISPQNTRAYTAWMLADGTLSSCIGLSFLFNALFDLRLLRARSIISYLTMVAGYAAICVGYHFRLPYTIIYRDVIGVSCGFFGLVQLARSFTNTHVRSALPLLFMSCLFGGVGFLGVSFPSVYCFLCSRLGPWAPESLWYYGADISMFFMFLFVARSHGGFVSADMIDSGLLDDDDNNDDDQEYVAPKSAAARSRLPDRRLYHLVPLHEPIAAVAKVGKA